MRGDEVSGEVRTLQHVVRRAVERHEGASARQLEALALRNHYKISASLLSTMLRGAYSQRPSEDTLEALWWLADLSPDVVYRAAGLDKELTSPAVLIARLVDGLPGDQQRELLARVERMVEDYKSG
jgi:hypothetical protein